MFMLLAISNCKMSIENAIQAEKKSKLAPEILGFRLIKGPWEKTYVLDVETKEEQVSALIICKSNGTMELAGPMKITPKEDKKEAK